MISYHAHDIDEQVASWRLIKSCKCVWAAGHLVEVVMNGSDHVLLGLG